MRLYDVCAMKTMSSRVLISFISLIVCAGCSVKENRTLCPCLLSLDFSEVDTAVIWSADIEVAAPDGLVFNDHIDSGDFDDAYTVLVPRRELQLCLWSGRGKSTAGEGLRIPYGEQCPPVYIHSSSINADCEKLHESVRMRKNHSRVTIHTIGYMPVKIALVGNVDGYAADGRPSLGNFRCSSDIGADGICAMVLPRQIDNTLVMELDDGTGVLQRFALGEYIAESGFDWTAPDLEDITIELDFAVTHITLVIQGWEKEYIFDVVI